MYKFLIRPILFKFNPEFVHKLTMKLICYIQRMPIAGGVARLLYRKEHPSLEREFFGLKFRNPVGLAGGLDKNGEAYNGMAAFGFGFVEIGSLTPKPQHGNPKPRLFRLVKDGALINRMGINNKGVKFAIDKLRSMKPEIIVAANIAKNTGSRDDQIAKDYDTAFSLLYDLVDMFVVNVSCPNVEGLTNLQDVSYLSEIMDGILDRRATMDEHKPIFIKLSPDVPNVQIDSILDYALRNGVEGVVAGNTTRKRDGLSTPEEKVNSIGKGGLSGAPLYERSLEMVKYIHQKSGGKLAIIGCGGIMTPAQAKAMLDAGASLIEVYTGFIYEGPGFVEKILKELDPPKKKKRKQAEAVVEEDSPAVIQNADTKILESNA